MWHYLYDRHGKTMSSNFPSLADAIRQARHDHDYGESYAWEVSSPGEGGEPPVVFKRDHLIAMFDLLDGRS